VRSVSASCDPVICDFDTVVDVDDDDFGVKSVLSCAIVYEDDSDFGCIDVVPSVVCQSDQIVLPSAKIDRESISHLSPEQQTELLALLDKYPECFSEVPVFTSEVTHRQCN